MENPRRAAFCASIVPDMAEYAERGYLNLLDTNNTFFDYDTELDEDWYDLDFVKGAPLPGPRRRRYGKASTGRGHSWRQGRAA